MRAKGRIRVRRKGMSKGAASFGAAASLAGIFGAVSVICPARLQSLMLYSIIVGGKTAGKRRGEVAERLKAAVC